MSTTRPDPIAEAISAETSLLGMVKPDASNDMRPERRTPCPACNGWHGSVNQERNCLVDTIIALRAKLARIEAENPRTSTMK